MTSKGARRLPFIVVGFAILFAGGYLAWQATHGGVVSHHLLDQRSLPAISNWWGLLTVPLIGALASWSVQRRAIGNPAELPMAAVAAGAAALVGVALSVAFFIDGTGNAPLYIILAALVAGLIVPAYRAEYVLGFFVGASYAFGLVLPIIPAVIVVAVSAASHFLVRPALAWVVRRIRQPA